MSGNDAHVLEKQLLMAIRNAAKMVSPVVQASEHGNSQSSPATTDRAGPDHFRNRFEFVRPTPTNGEDGEYTATECHAGSSRSGSENDDPTDRTVALPVGSTQSGNPLLTCSGWAQELAAMSRSQRAAYLRDSWNYCREVCRELYADRIALQMSLDRGLDRLQARLTIQELANIDRNIQMQHAIHWAASDIDCGLRAGETNLEEALRTGRHIRIQIAEQTLNRVTYKEIKAPLSNSSAGTLFESERTMLHPEHRNRRHQCAPADLPHQSFDRFPDLPREMRNRIYSYVLVSDKPILPHLCSERRDIKFHNGIAHTDHGRPRFTSISHSLAITFVSKQIREESLPIFYNVNTFAFSADTPVYFEHLTHMGRFQWVHQIHFPINFYNQETGDRAMCDVHRNLIKQVEYEEKTMKTQSKFSRTLSPKWLLDNPAYLAGGLYYVGVFLVMRKLALTYASTPANKDYKRKLVLRVPNSAIFTKYELLHWFPKVAASLDIELKLINGADLEFKDGRCIAKWQLRYQKKDASEEGQPITSQNSKEMIKRFNKECPKSTGTVTGNSVSYYRRNCEGNKLDWFKVERN